MPQLEFFEERQIGLTLPYLEIETELWEQGLQDIAGVDEAGRGPLAGPVVAAACILPRHVRFTSVRDSKQLQAEERKEAYQELIAHPRVIWAVSIVDSNTIDALNILRATLLAMKQAVEALTLKKRPHFILIDGRDTPPLDIPSRAVIKGDSLSQSIAAASIIAKETRDTIMERYAEQYPEWGFAQHKGYGTEVHLAAIEKYGLTPIHRQSFAPVAKKKKSSQLTFF